MSGLTFEAPVSETELVSLRRRSLGLLPGVGVSGSKATAQDALDNVSRMLALQGQHLGGTMWSIGMRHQGLTELDVTELFNSGQLIRTWPFRGTLHVMTPRDASAVLSVMGPRALKTVTTRHEVAGLPERKVEQATVLFLQAAHEQGPLGRDAIADLLKQVGLEATYPQVRHFIFTLCLRNVAVWGPMMGNEQGLVPTSDAQVRTNHEPNEVLRKIVRGVVSGRGPLTVEDIAYWTSLGKGVVTSALNELGEDITWITRVGDPRKLAVLTSTLESHDFGQPARDIVMCAGFEELLLGYRDRTPQLKQGHIDHIVPGKNGMFKPFIVYKNQVVGTWAKKDKAGGLVIEPNFFAVGKAGPSKVLITGLEREVRRYGKYKGKATSLAKQQ